MSKSFDPERIKIAVTFLIFNDTHSQIAEPSKEVCEKLHPKITHATFYKTHKPITKEEFDVIRKALQTNDLNAIQKILNNRTDKSQNEDKRKASTSLKSVSKRSTQ